jgi:hypothetical protein
MYSLISPCRCTAGDETPPEIGRNLSHFDTKLFVTTPSFGKRKNLNGNELNEPIYYSDEMVVASKQKLNNPDIEQLNNACGRAVDHVR